jgi:hypothetical protein
MDRYFSLEAERAFLSAQSRRIEIETALRLSAMWPS